jgi:hypothetical protein
MDVFFLFPGGVLVWILFVAGIRTDKKPTGQKSFVCFGTFRRDTEFRFPVSILCTAKRLQYKQDSRRAGSRGG